MTLILQFVFACLALVVIAPIFPLRWALLSYLLIIHVDIPRIDLEVQGAVATTNFVNAILLPSVLLLRTRLAGLIPLRETKLLWAWFAFIAYVVVASTWTEYPFPAIKQIGYLYCYTALFGVFTYAFRDPTLRMGQIVSLALVGSILLAVIQTYLLGNSFSSVAGRLTSFTAAQPFGLYLAVSFGLVMSFARSRQIGAGWATILSALILGALFLNGSRSGMATVMALGVFALLPIARVSIRSILLPIVAVNVAILAFAALFYLSPARLDAVMQSRPMQMFQLLTQGASATQDIGTLRWRLKASEALLHLIRDRPWGGIVFGSGTSSSADLIVYRHIRYRDYDEDTVDANRTAHNESLRSLYEWGLVGSVFFFVTLLGLIIGSLRIARADGSPSAYLLAFMVTLALTVYFLLGNMLAAAAEPIGISITLALGAITAAGLRVGIPRSAAANSRSIPAR